LWLGIQVIWDSAIIKTTTGNLSMRREDINDGKNNTHKTLVMSQNTEQIMNTIGMTRGNSNVGLTEHQT
jgi:hypothetical protein